MQCSEVVGEKMLIHKTKLTKKFSRNIKKGKKKKSKPPNSEYILKRRYSTGKHQGKQSQKNLY